MFGKYTNEHFIVVLQAEEETGGKDGEGGGGGVGLRPDGAAEGAGPGGCSVMTL